MKKFLELVSKDEETGKKLSGADKEMVLALAKELGVILTEADFVQKNELDDDELDTVAGGAECGCAMGGGGQAGDNKCRCVCIFGGWVEKIDGVMRGIRPGITRFGL